MSPRLSAYALAPSNGARLLALRSIVGISGKDPSTRTTWIHVGYTGSWDGHGEGPFKLDAKDLQSCVAAFNAQTNPISSDYEHASLVADGQPKPAAMWTQKLRVQGDDLYALVEFTPRAAELVRAGEYRFCSGVFAFGVPDRVEGNAKRWPCVLRSIALTNDPFLDGQKPIALTARGVRRALTGGSMAKITKADIVAGLKQIEGDEMSSAQLAALIDSIAAMAAAKDPKTGEEPEEAPASADAPVVEAEEPALAADPEVAEEAACSAVLAAEPPPPAPPTPPAEQANADGAAMAGAKLLEASGLDGAALLAALETNLEAVISALRGSGGQVADLTAAATASTITALSARIAVFEKRDADIAAKAKADAAMSLSAARKAEVEALVSDGKILPAQVDVYRDLAEKAPAQFRALTASLPKGAAFPVGTESALAGADPNPRGVNVIDETRPEVIALRRMYAGKPKEIADRAVLATFGQVG
jgi:phage I-like protein